MPLPDVFQQITASADGEYLWSNPLNWTEGVPTDGDGVVIGALGFDDLGSLNLTSLTLNTGGRAVVTGASLDVTSVTLASGTEVLADAHDAGAPVMVTLGTVAGSAGYIVANGAGARLIDQSAVDQGEIYYVGDSGFVEITAPPSSASILDYITTPGTFALAEPAASNAVEIAAIAQGDALEVPGTAVTDVSFGTSSLSVTTNAGTYDFTNVDYGVPITGYTATPDTTTGLEEITFIAADVFQQITASADGEYLWSNPLNWTEGVPTDGDGVVIGALGFDDLGSLNLTSLTLNTGGRAVVTGASLDVTSVTLASGTEVLADAHDAGAPVMVTLGTVAGSAGYIVANGAGARLIDQSAVDQGEIYYVGDSGFVEITAPPSSASILDYITTPGTFALAEPAASNAVEIAAIAQGDALEVPGTAVTDVSFGTSSLSVTTNAGTYDFTNVDYGVPITGYTATPDTTTGLEEITFIAADVFQQITASADGEYLWSNPLNWTEGVPTDGDSVVIGALGFDDLGSLNLASLTLNTGGRAVVTGASLDVTSVTLASGTEVLADAHDAGAPVMVTLGTVAGSAGYIVANGAGARLIDQSAVDQGETYYVGDGGFVEITAPPSSTSILDYITTPGTFALAEPAASNAVEIAPIAPGDALEVPGTTLTDVSFGTSSLSVTTNAGTYDFTNVNYLSAPTGYIASHDATTGLEAVDIACFVEGTRVRTERGAVAVEALQVGDRVPVVMGGRAQPIIWLGHRRVDCRRHREPKQVWPVCLAAGAFGPGRPFRDLWLSPDHAVFANGVLIPVRYLVNGRTIRQQARGNVTYWHVELAEHNVLYAEGVPAESYLDTGNRSAFANGGPVMALHPDFALHTWEAHGCAPLVLNGPKVAAAKRRLHDRANALGHRITDNAGLTVLADGNEVVARRWRGVLCIRLPDGTADVRLVSRVWTPAHMQPDANDARSLGVAISRMWVDAAEISLDHPCLYKGWHAPEPAWRWTDGDAWIAISGARVLAFEVMMAGSYWQEAQDSSEVPAA